MNLVAFSPEHLRVNTPLPFDVVDSGGHLLMPKGDVISSVAQLKQLLAHKLYVNEEQTEAWRRNLAGTIDSMVRQNVVLKTIAEAGAEAAHPLVRPQQDIDLCTEVADLQARAATLLAETRPDAAWAQRVARLAERLRPLVARWPDALMYLLVQTSTRVVEHYSSHHALLCAAVTDLCAAQMEWPESERETLVCAAITMNIGMTSLQNVLAQQETPLNAGQRSAVTAHPEVGALLLRQAGVSDPLWLEVVERHHEKMTAPLPLHEAGPAERLARLLNRVDVFTAKISPRAKRTGMPAPLAARDACLGADGKPDDLGSAIIKTLGVYPPGSFVLLANGEVAVVLRRGARAGRPQVASIVGREGQPLGVPALRLTADPRFEIKSSVRVADVRVRLSHERMLKL